MEKTKTGIRNIVIGMYFQYILSGGNELVAYIIFGLFSCGFIIDMINEFKDTQKGKIFS